MGISGHTRYAIALSQSSSKEGEDVKVKVELQNIVKRKHSFNYIIIFSVLMLVCNVIPFASYIYGNVKYTITGIEFITGKVIAGGRVVVATNLALCLAVAANFGLLIVSILYSKLKVRIGAGALSILSIISLVGYILIGLSLNKLLPGVKNVRISYGPIIIAILGVTILIRNVYILWKEKVILTYDFMIIPGMLYFIINNYIPMVGISIAFKKIDYSLGILKSPWVGFDNFKILFASTGNFLKSDAFIITRNTLLYNIVFIVLGTVMGIIVGIFLAEIFSRTLQKFYQTAILLPQLISMVIVAYIAYGFLSNEAGMINKILGENQINFYSTEKYWPPILIFVYIWKQIGYSSIIYLSSIVGIDNSIYEAAKVDGVTRWKQIRYITLPLLKPTIITLMLLQVGRIFYSDFGLFYQVPMDSGVLYNVTNTIDTYVYRSLMVSNNISTASAASAYQAIVGFVIVLSVNLIVRKLDKENALF